VEEMKKLFETSYSSHKSETMKRAKEKIQSPAIVACPPNEKEQFQSCSRQREILSDQ
jgi:hypothetical protein